MYQTVFNPTSTSVPVAANGRSIGGGEWGTIDSREQLARLALERGSLIVGDDSVVAAGGEAETAAAETRRLQGLAGRSKAELAEVAERAGVDPKQPKDTLVAELAAADVDVETDGGAHTDKPKRAGRRGQGE